MANKEALENTAALGDDKAEALKTVNGALQDVSDQEVLIISKEIEAITDDINTIEVKTSTTATTPPPITPVGP